MGYNYYSAFRISYGDYTVGITKWGRQVMDVGLFSPNSF